MQSRWVLILWLWQNVLILDGSYTRSCCCIQCSGIYIYIFLGKSWNWSFEYFHIACVLLWFCSTTMEQKLDSIWIFFMEIVVVVLGKPSSQLVFLKKISIINFFHDRHASFFVSVQKDRVKWGPVFNQNPIRVVSSHTMTKRLPWLEPTPSWSVWWEGKTKGFYLLCWW